MSKGKQWWPLQATVEDSKKSILEFQDRLRDRQWIKKTERTALFHIYTKDVAWPTEHLTSINEYMQISTNDPASKNHARVTVARMLCMLLKWHSALRSQDPLLSPPAVFSAPNLQTGGFHYGLVATIAPSNKPGSRPLTLIISEQELGSEQSGAKHFCVPQASDTYRWLTLKTWQDQRQKPSFGKWIYGSYTERRQWAEQDAISKNIKAQGLIQWSSDVNDPKKENKIAAIKMMGALYHPATTSWLLPDFWDEEAVLEYLQMAPEAQRPKTGRMAYQKMVHTRPEGAPEWSAPPSSDEPQDA